MTKKSPNPLLGDATKRTISPGDRFVNLYVRLVKDPPDGVGSPIAVVECRCGEEVEMSVMRLNGSCPAKYCSPECPLRYEDKLAESTPAVTVPMPAEESPEVEALRSEVVALRSEKEKQENAKAAALAELATLHTHLQALRTERAESEEQFKGEIASLQDELQAMREAEPQADPKGFKTVSMRFPLLDWALWDRRATKSGMALEVYLLEYFKASLLLERQRHKEEQWKKEQMRRCQGI